MDKKLKYVVHKRSLNGQYAFEKRYNLISNEWNAKPNYKEKHTPPDLKTEIWQNRVLMSIWSSGNSYAADGREKTYNIFRKQIGTLYEILRCIYLMTQSSDSQIFCSQDTFILLKIIKNFVYVS